MAFVSLVNCGNEQSESKWLMKMYTVCLLISVSNMVPYSPVWSRMVLYDLILHRYNCSVWSCMVLLALYGTLWYHKVPYGPVRTCMVPYGLVWSCMVLYGPLGTVWSYCQSLILTSTCVKSMSSSWRTKLSLVWHSLVKGCRAISDLNFGFVRLLLLFLFFWWKRLLFVSIQSLFTHIQMLTISKMPLRDQRGPRDNWWVAGDGRLMCSWLYQVGNGL